MFKAMVWTCNCVLPEACVPPRPNLLLIGPYWTIYWYSKWQNDLCKPWMMMLSVLFMLTRLLELQRMLEFVIDMSPYNDNRWTYELITGNFTRGNLELIALLKGTMVIAYRQPTQNVHLQNCSAHHSQTSAHPPLLHFKILILSATLCHVSLFHRI